MTTMVIQIPIDKLPIVEKILGRALAVNQTPTVNVRVPRSKVDEIRKAMK